MHCVMLDRDVYHQNLPSSVPGEAGGSPRPSAYVARGKLGPSNKMVSTITYGTVPQPGLRSMVCEWSEWSFEANTIWTAAAPSSSLS